MRNLSQQINQESSLKQLMEDVLKRAKACGATDAAVTVNQDMGFGIDVRMGSVETVAFSEDRGVSVTVYVGQQKGSASSSDTSSNALDTMVSAALDIAKVSAKDPCFGLPDKDLIQPDYPALDLLHAWDITPEAAIELATNCETMARDKDKRIHNSDGANVSTYTFCHGYANTLGFSGVVSSSRHSLSCSLLAEDTSGMQRDYAYTTARNAADLMRTEDVAALAAERTIQRLSPQKLGTQKTPVVFSSRVSSGLLGAFIQAVSGASLYKKNSFLLESIGEKIFPQNIKIYESPHLKGALGSAPFDAEGIITRPNVLIEAGVLKQYVLGSYSARKLGLKTTANSGGVFNLTAAPTAGDLDDVLQKMDKGLFVTELMGQGINPITGDYSRGASGFWIEGGKIQYPVDEITIAGNLKDMFQKVQAIGTDIEPSSATRCGSILIEEMMVAGS